jgi:hypothetical protein
MKTLENKTPEAIPPFILFGAIEANPETSPAISYYDPISQKSIYPYGMGSDKKSNQKRKERWKFTFSKVQKHE